MTINDRISSLGPPRSGRIVKDPKEVIKELEAQARDAKENGIIVPEIVVPSKPEGDIVPARTINFQTGDLVLTVDGDYHLYDIDVEEGHWKDLLLVGSPALMGREQKWEDWENMIFPGDRVICPIKTLYWFMRAAYEQKDRQTHDAAHFQEFIQKEIENGGWHHADMFGYDLSDLTSVSTMALESNHPLHYSFVYQSLGGNISVPMMPGMGLEEFLGKLLGDNDPEHVNAVLSWCTGRKNGILCFPPGDNTYDTCGAFGVEDDQNYRMFLNQSPDNPLPMHLVEADPAKFTPRARPAQTGGKP